MSYLLYIWSEVEFVILYLKYYKNVKMTVQNMNLKFCWSYCDYE